MCAEFVFDQDLISFNNLLLFWTDCVLGNSGRRRRLIVLAQWAMAYLSVSATVVTTVLDCLQFQSFSNCGILLMLGITMAWRRYNIVTKGLL